MDNAFVTKSWQTDKNFKYQCTNSTWCKAGHKAAEIFFRDLKLYDLIQLYENPSNFEFAQPLWSSNSLENFDEMYMSRVMSYNMLVLWIGYEFFDLQVDDKMQFNKADIDEQLWLDIANFILEWCNWFEGRIDRRFTYVLLGGTKSGKTMFADLIMDLKVNVGVMGNWNRNSSFPLNMCVNKSMYYLNEPDIEQSALEEWKKIAGGDKHTLQVKYLANVTQSRVPVLLTSNKPPLPRNDIFNSRCIYKNVKQAGFLIKANGKRYHPMCIVDLIRQCEIVLKQEIINPI